MIYFPNAWVKQNHYLPCKKFKAHSSSLDETFSVKSQETKKSSKKKARTKCAGWG
jgi:hypothetical protein